MARLGRGDPQGGFQRSVLKPPLVGGAAWFWRRGGNPPAPAFPRRGKRERGRPPSLLPEAIPYPLRPEPPPSRPPPQSPYSHSKAGIPKKEGGRKGEGEEFTGGTKPGRPPDLPED